MPIQRFELLTDRAGYKSARARRAILEVIAGKANSNGTGSYVNDDYIASKIGFTERHIREQRKILRQLGLLSWTDKRGFQGDEKGWGSNLYTVTTGENWPRRHGIRKLFENPEILEAPEPNPEVSDESKLNPEVSGLNQEVSAVNPEVSKLNPEVITSPNRPSSLPPLKPTALPTAQPDGTEGGQVPSGQKQDLISRLSVKFVEVTGKFLNIRDDLLSLAAEVGDDQVDGKWEPWLRNRNLENMECPLVFFVREFSSIQALVKKQADDAQAAKDKKEGRTKVRREVEKSERDRKVWREGLEATADIDAYIAGNPCPPYYVDIDGKLETLASDGPELIQNARHRLANPMLTAEEKQAMAEAIF